MECQRRKRREEEGKTVEYRNYYWLIKALGVSHARSTRLPEKYHTVIPECFYRESSLVHSAYYGFRLRVE